MVVPPCNTLSRLANCRIGRFTEELDGDQVMWGNVFERPIRDSLPWGTSIATKFM